VEEAAQTGRILGGRYRLGERLGQGGWGSVYAAVQMDLGRPVAIKVLHQSVALSSDGLLRFEREAKAAAALGHPNIAQVSDFAANPGEPPFLVMELLTGATLGAAMRHSTKLAPARTAWIAYQILAGLDVAHNAGIVHRDIKPDNVFLVAMPGVEDFVKLLDFGIAKLSSDTSQHLTTTGTMLGSPAFMAPEQVRSNEVDHRVDLYAVGATMYLALSGRMPFEASTLHALLLAITEQRCVPLHALDPSIDPALSRVVERAMQKDPNARFATAAEMRGALEPWLGGMAAHASATVGAPRTVPTAPMAQMPPTAAMTHSHSSYGPPPNGQYPGSLSPNQVGQGMTNSATAMTPAASAMPGSAPAKGGGAVVALLAAVVVLLLVLVGGAGFYFYSQRPIETAAATGAPSAGAPAVAGAAPPSSVAANGAPASPAAAAGGAGGAGGAGAKGKTGATGAAGAPGAVVAPGPAGAPAAAGAPGAPAPAAIVADAGAPAGGAKKQFAGTNFRIGGGAFDGFDIDASKAAIMAKGGAIGGCYAATELDPPDHQFTDWTFQVDPAGNVKSVGRTTAFDPHPKFDACMVGVLRQVKWAASKAGGAPHVNFTARTRDNP
jgi:hypothetical protein